MSLRHANAWHGARTDEQTIPLAGVADPTIVAIYRGARR